jgi:hypothetical protein
MTESDEDKGSDLSGEKKMCGCSVETECDHYISNFQRYCKYNPSAPECKIFDI